MKLTNLLKIFLLTAACLLIGLTAVSCHSNGKAVSASDTAAAVPAEVSLSDVSLTVGKGLTMQLSASGGEIMTWRSSDEAVAAVDGSGTVRGVSVGNCVITAQNEYGNTAECAVQVKKTCYLTLDDGPNENTEAILQVLKKHDVRATFFVVSSHNLALTKEIHEQGCVVGIHTYSHKYESCYSGNSSYFYGVELMERRVEKYIGMRPNLLRFPGGTHNTVCDPLIMQRLANGAKDMGYRVFDWTATAGDTSAKNASASFSIKNVKKTCTEDEEILLMHEKPFNVEALETILPYLKESGYVFATLDNYPEESYMFATRYSKTNKQIPSTAVAIGLTSAKIKVGGKITLARRITPSNSTDYTRWESADTSIADVLPDGTVTGIAAGTVEIYAITSSGQKAASTITVTPS